MKTVHNKAPGGQPLETTDTPERDLLRAIVEALDVPIPDRYDDNDKRLRLLKERALWAQSYAKAALADQDATAPAAKLLREKTANTPATYAVDGGEL